MFSTLCKCNGEAGHDDAYHRHELDEDVERGTAGVLEGVAAWKSE